MTSSPRTPLQGHRSINPPKTPPRGPNWPPGGGYEQPLRNYSPQMGGIAPAAISAEDGTAVNPEHIDLKISNIRASNDHSLYDNPYKGR